MTTNPFSLKISQIFPNLHYVDEITTLAQLQISYLAIAKSSKFENSKFYNKLATNFPLPIPVLPIFVFAEIFFQEIQR